MVAQNPFSSPQRLIRRAKEHIDQAEGLIEAFFQARPYAPIVEVDRHTGQQVFKIKLNRLLPDDIDLMIKEAATHLRDALDHACFAAAVSLGNPSPTKTGFPFARNTEGVEGELRSGRLRDNPPELHSLLVGFNPHEGGNYLLWGLNSIRNPNTHRFIVPVGQAVTTTTQIFGGTIKGGTSVGYSRWDAAKNEVEYMRVGAGSHVNPQVSATFSVVFEGTHALAGRPVIPILKAITNEVCRVGIAIEQDTARIIASRP